MDEAAWAGVFNPDYLNFIWSNRMHHSLKKHIVRWCLKRRSEFTYLAGGIFVILVITFWIGYARDGEIIRLDAESIPENIIKFVEAFAFLSSVGAIFWLRALLWFERHDNPRAFRDVGDFLSLPHDLTNRNYYFCLSTDPASLQPFVELSDAEAHIAEPNNLFDVRRSQLYQKWLRWNKFAFLILYKRKDYRSSWNAVSVSICLPLRQEGVEFLMVEDGVAIDLEREHIADGEDSTAALLFDTWITARAERNPLPRRTKKVARVNTNRHSYVLVLIHIGIFLKTKRLPIIAEASLEDLGPRLESVGFVSADRPGNKHFYLSPLIVQQNEGPIQRIWENIEALRSHPVEHLRG